MVGKTVKNTAGKIGIVTQCIEVEGTGRSYSHVIKAVFPPGKEEVFLMSSDPDINSDYFEFVAS